MNPSQADRFSGSPLPDRNPVEKRPSFGPQRHRPLPRYKVILHREPLKDLMFIVRSVMELTRFPRAEATHKMWETHHHGRSIILVTYLERAELYVEQFANKGLPASVEPA
jgi:ATP-dependent Clp protease adapter protein ClpS